MPGDHGVRRARPADASALVGLRVELMRAMGEDGAEDRGWQDRALTWFRDALAGDDAAAFVVDDGGAVVTGALVTLGRGAPSARNPRGVTAHLSNVCTLPPARGRGHARACVVAAVDWARGAGADSVALHATPAGEGLYRALGFTDTTYTELRLRW
ncbi:GNAT family N-acetyltransferase [Cellulosimicrobium marinum]|uniref:GNAT family N-acetyltransferase n=1 Tax=Cellulosimicrobium marinum TaxID=1638992 RepID=UPI001E2C7E6D|nr:GNAT family N-acetyltransferase [Cellulosimicrobium marinum]MCB7137801.1 GNAT family N-acetyltransferase [Cellulosimicrobium marinum]